jgi:hypothetical protein
LPTLKSAPRALALELAHQSLTGAQRRRVVGARESAVTGEHEHDRRVDVLGHREELGRTGRIGLGRLDDDASHPVSIRAVRDDARLAPRDLGGGNEFHRLRDLARGLHRLDASTTGIVSSQPLVPA